MKIFYLTNVFHKIKKAALPQIKTNFECLFSKNGKTIMTTILPPPPPKKTKQLRLLITTLNMIQLSFKRVKLIWLTVYFKFHDELPLNFYLVFKRNLSILKFYAPKHMNYLAFSFLDDKMAIQYFSNENKNWQRESPAEAVTQVLERLPLMSKTWCWTPNLVAVLLPNTLECSQVITRRFYFFSFSG